MRKVFCCKGTMGPFKALALFISCNLVICNYCSLIAAEVMVANGDVIDTDTLLVRGKGRVACIPCESNVIETPPDWKAEVEADKEESKTKDKIKTELEFESHKAGAYMEIQYNITIKEFEFIIGRADAYYCDKYGPLHVLCGYKVTRTGMRYWLRGINQTDINFIMSFLTTLRKRLLLGKEDKGWKFPKAFRMRQLKWNQELAVIAQRLTNQCSGKLNNSIIMATDSFSRLTTTLAMSRDNVAKPRWSQALMLWYDQVKNVKSDITFRKYEDMDTYTAMVWGNSGYVGCGFTACHGNKPEVKVKVYSCVFGPGGNMHGNKIYATSQVDIDNMKQPEKPVACIINSEKIGEASTTVRPTSKENPFKKVT